MVDTSPDSFMESGLFLFARHVCQLESESPLPNLMEVKD
jgi:hypothetical protein